MPRHLKIACCFLFPIALNAQQLSSKGRFSVEAAKGCAPFTVNITELDAFGAVTRTYFYVNGKSSSTDLTFTYNKAGIYKMVQVVGVDEIPDKTDTISIEAIAPQKPQVAFSRCSGLGISVKSNDIFYDSVRIYFTGTDSVSLANGAEASFNYSTDQPQTIVLKGLFNNATETCKTYTEEIIPADRLTTPQIVNASIKESCRDIYTLYLNINQFDPLTDYRISIKQPSTNVLFEGKPDSTIILIGDIPFEMRDFCILIETISPCTNTVVGANEFCGFPSSLSLSPFESLYTAYRDSSVYINIDQVSSGTFDVQRRLEGGNFERRALSVGSFKDPIGSLTRKYYYKIDYIDSCGGTLYSAKTNPPLISATKIEKNTHQIVFEKAVNSLSTASENSYFIGNSKEPVVAFDFDIQLSPEDGTDKQFLYSESTYSTGEVLKSNTLAFKYEFIIYAPNAFTPNGDGLNDKLEFFGISAKGVFLLRIYSRWGQLLYESTEIENGWDGSVSGSSAPDGTYLYEIVF